MTSDRQNRRVLGRAKLPRVRSVESDRGNTHRAGSVDKSTVGSEKNIAGGQKRGLRAKRVGVAGKVVDVSNLVAGILPKPAHHPKFPAFFE